jgi:hypothetical protein
MIEVLFDRPSDTGESLQGVLFRVAEGFPTANGWVNWTGRRLCQDDYLAPVLNCASRTDKLAQLVRLEMRGVSIPPFKPAGTLWPIRHAGVGDWIPRTSFHQQGRDFTRPPADPDFWVKKLYLEDEWRLHFFRTNKGNIKLLRSGLKLPKTLKAHPWVKSHRLGWKISYLGGAPSHLVVEARKAMAALDLDFGAVDCALTYQGEPVVLEVNTCPGLEETTLELYVREILERLT